MLVGLSIIYFPLSFFPSLLPFSLTCRRVGRLLLAGPPQLKDSPFTWTEAGGGEDVGMGGEGA